MTTTKTAKTATTTTSTTRRMRAPLAIAAAFGIALACALTAGPPRAAYANDGFSAEELEVRVRAANAGLDPDAAAAEWAEETGNKAAPLVPESVQDEQDAQPAKAAQPEKKKTTDAATSQPAKDAQPAAAKSSAKSAHYEGEPVTIYPGNGGGPVYAEWHVIDGEWCATFVTYNGNTVVARPANNEVGWTFWVTCDGNTVQVERTAEEGAGENTQSHWREVYGIKRY